MSTPSIDPKSFRDALGNFATGVTIITTSAPDGEPVGLTVNSFNSVSLDPPLVLWSLARDALSLEIFQNTEHWAVHVLSSTQQNLSNLFASRGGDKFSQVETEAGVGGIPMLMDCTARFQCKTAYQYEGGDHVIFVGEVLDYDRSEAAPLVFHGGRYAHATHRVQDHPPRSPWLGGSFNDNFLGYLLGRSHFQFYGRIRPLLEAESLSDDEFYILSTLTLKHNMSLEQINTVMQGVLDHVGNGPLSALQDRGFIQLEDDEYSLTQAGSDCALRLISAAKAVEAQVVESLGEEEAAVLKTLLTQLLDGIDPVAAELWEEPED